MNPENSLVLESLAAARLPQPCGSALAAAQSAQVALHDHLAMVQAYRKTGGLVTCDQAAMLLGRHRDQPISVLARWIVARAVVSFVWQSETLVPLFQFDLVDMSLRRGVSEVIAELAGALDDLELATWFIRPNCWLAEAAPIALIEADRFAVLQAARADRYLARG